jgi:tetratricopeptide (TPR) repeat protein
MILILGGLTSVQSLFATDIDGEIRTEPNSGFAVNATVQLLQARFLLDERIVGTDGRFKFRNITSGSYVIVAKLEGYTDEEVPLLIERRSPREFVAMTLRPAKPLTDRRGQTISVTEYQVPETAKREYEEGFRQRKRGNCAQALPHLQKAVAAYEQYAEAHDILGDCFKRAGDLASAEASFKKAVLYGRTIYPSMNLADLYSERRQFNEAEFTLQQAFSKYPSEGDLHFAMALLYFNQGKIKEAEQQGLTAHSKIHRNADVHLLLSKVYLRLREYPKLKLELETYLAENPKSPLAFQVRQTLSDLGKTIK